MDFDCTFNAVDTAGCAEALLKIEAQFMWDLVCTLPAGSRIIEIGCEYGRSSVLLAMLAKDRGLHLTCVDLWIGWDGKASDCQGAREASIWMNRMRMTGAEFTLHCMTSQAALELEAARGPYDLVYIDALHTDESLRLDLQWAAWLTKGGLLLVHDYDREYFPEVKAVTDEVLTPDKWGPLSIEGYLAAWRRR